MPRPSRAVVRDLAEAVAALRAAAARGARRVELESPPGAAAWMGAGYFRALVAAAAEAVPGIAAVSVLDCGRDAGYALEALRAGVPVVVVAAPAPVFRRLADIARQRGATLRPPPRSRTRRTRSHD